MPTPWHFLLLVGVAAGQTSIPDNGATLELVDIVTLPDSGSGNSAPPRISVVTADPSGRLFANDQRGPLYFIDEAGGTFTEFLDLRDYPTIPVVSTFEAGFQSFAFHPDFHDETAPGYGRFYTVHSCSNTTPTPDFDTPLTAGFHTLLLEWATTAPESTVFIPANAAAPFREVMRLDQPYGNHNAGLVAFDPLLAPGDQDYGLLYFAVGDGGSANDPQNNGQTASNPFGSILRVDPLGSDSANGAYGIPSQNAFALDGEPGTLAENYSIGLRNPQRFGWDLRTGNAYLADIGQDTFEEINPLANGGNFGWDAVEGGGGSPTYLDPVAGYFHTTTFAGSPPAVGGRAITCGEVLRGTCISGFDGMLVLADFPSGRVFRLNVDTDPLDGGVDGLDEVRFSLAGGSRALFLDLIYDARSARGLGTTNRADVRFSVNTPGRVYLSNKHDGIVRRVVPDLEPEIDLMPDGTLNFVGLLEESDDLVEWRLVLPQPTPGQPLSYDKSHRYLRGVRK